MYIGTSSIGVGCGAQKTATEIVQGAAYTTQLAQTSRFSSREKMAGYPSWVTTGQLDYEKGLGHVVTGNAAINYEIRYLPSVMYLGPLRGSEARVAAKTLGLSQRQWEAIECSSPKGPEIGAQGISSFGEDPRKVFGLLRDAGWNFRKVGDATVRGAERTVYETSIQTAAGSKNNMATIEVAVDSTGLVRRIREETKGYTLVREFYDFGVPVQVKPPNTPDVIHKSC
jgi:hypothetical protein